MTFYNRNMLRPGTMKSSFILLSVLVLFIPPIVSAQESADGTKKESDEFDEPDIILSAEQSNLWFEELKTCGDLEGELCRAKFRALLDDKQVVVFDRLFHESKR